MSSSRFILYICRFCNVSVSSTRGQLQQLPLHTSNQFTPLLNLKEDVEGSRYPRNGSCYKVLSNNMVKNDKRKIVIIEDSHARNCASGLQRQLGRKFL